MKFGHFLACCLFGLITGFGLSFSVRINHAEHTHRHHPPFPSFSCLLFLRWHICVVSTSYYYCILYTHNVLRHQMASCKTNARIDKLRDASAASSKSFSSVLEGLLRRSRRSRLWVCSQTSSTCGWAGVVQRVAAQRRHTAAQRRATVNYRFQVPEAAAKESCASASRPACAVLDFCLELELSHRESN